jgi:uncharacterized protein (DUF1800 family)
MGNENTLLDAASARHLLRRAGFGAPLDEVDRLVNAGMTRGEAADELLDFTPSNFRPNAARDDRDKAHNKWLKYMVKTRFPLQEKLVLFWHDHFATNITVVQDVTFMANQNRTLRRNCKGIMRDLVKAINKDAAMMRFLDTDDNRKAQPNENYARELQELFTLGVNDFAGNANYLQEDIVQIARAFSGWRYEDNGTPFLNANQHDFMANFPGRGPKVIYEAIPVVRPVGNAGVLARPDGGDFTQPGGEGEAEIDNVIDIIFSHTDTNGKNTVARRTTKRLLEYFARPFADPIPGADVTAIDEIIANGHNGGGSSFATTFDIAALLRSIFTHDFFYPSVGSTQNSVKWPMDYVVSTLRLLDMKLKGRDQYVNGGDFARALDRLRNMGQEVMDPPSVFGWNWETSWVSSAAMLSRYAFVRDCTTARYGSGRTTFRPVNLIGSAITPAELVDRVALVLGVADQLSAAERQDLIDYMNAGPEAGNLDAKLNGLFALVLQSPAYQLH